MTSISIKSLALAAALLATVATASVASAADGLGPTGPDTAYLKLRLGMMTNELKADVGIMAAKAHEMQAGMFGE